MDENEHQLLAVGLPETGKTSFIHAVDDLLQSPPTPEALRCYGLARDRSYLERDKASFRAGKKLVHTERSLQDPAPELWFEDPSTGRRGRLFLPDLRGEIFQDQWTDRRWTESFRDDLKTISGALVFVRADTPASNQELLGQMANWGPTDAKPAPWDPKKASPQVQLVDVLQFIGTQGQISRPLRVAVLISAWDTVGKPADLQPKNPNEFLAREWSLLDQYLRSNAETYVTKVYGVSALGGTEDELKELSRLPPQDRVNLVEDMRSSKDLTRPLRWLLKLD
jgi:hypothetical protein